MTDSFLSNIIIRINYSDLTDVSGIISFLADDRPFQDMFGRHDVIKDIPLEGEDPVSVHRFSEMKLFTKNSYLDISEKYMCLVINCIGVEHLSDNQMIGILLPIWGVIRDKDSFSQITRIGFRKVWGKTFETAEDADHVVAYFDQGLMKNEEAIIKRRYIDVFWSKKFKCAMNSIRSVLTVNEECALRFTLDLDAYNNMSREDDRRPSPEGLRTLFDCLSGLVSDVQGRSFVDEYFNDEVNE